MEYHRIEARTLSTFFRLILGCVVSNFVPINFSVKRSPVPVNLLKILWREIWSPRLRAAIFLCIRTWRTQPVSSIIAFYFSSRTFEIFVA